MTTFIDKLTHFKRHYMIYPEMRGIVEEYDNLSNNTIDKLLLGPRDITLTALESVNEYYETNYDDTHVVLVIASLDDMSQTYDITTKDELITFIENLEI